MEILIRNDGVRETCIFEEEMDLRDDYRAGKGEKGCGREGKVSLGSSSRKEREKERKAYGLSSTAEGEVFDGDGFYGGREGHRCLSWALGASIGEGGRGAGGRRDVEREIESRLHARHLEAS